MDTKTIYTTPQGSVTITINKTKRGWTVVAGVALGENSKYVETLTQSGHKTKADAHASVEEMKEYYVNRIAFLASKAAV